MSMVYNLSTLTRRPLQQTFHSFTLDEYGLIKDFWLHDLLKTLKVKVLWPFINFWPNSEKSSKELGQEVFIFSCQAAKSTLECNKQTNTHTHSTMQTDANTHRHTHTHTLGVFVLLKHMRPCFHQLELIRLCISISSFSLFSDDLTETHMINISFCVCVCVCFKYR